MKTRIIESSSEIGAGTRGSRLGVDALRTVAHNRRDTILLDREHLTIENHNNILVHDSETRWAINAIYYQKTFELALEKVAQAVEGDQPVLFLTGDHSNAAALISGIRKKKPSKKLGIIWIDAHADLHSPFTTPSGNMHGMPLALVTGYPNEEHVRNEPSEKTQKIWSDLIAHSSASPLPKLAFIALRDTQKEEEALIERHNLPVVTVAQLAEKGAKAIAQQFNTYLSDCDEVYISFDVDSMDSETVSDGTGTPVPNGLSLQQSKDIVHALFEKIPKIKYFEITEINPLLDTKGNSMADAAFDVMKVALEHLDKKV